METSFILTGVTVIILIYLFKKYFIDIYDYWDKRGIPCVPGALPFFGHTISIFWSYKSIPCFCDEINKSHRGRSMIGLFQGRHPNLIVQDPELVKKVLISGFSNFNQSVLSIDPKLDPLLAENPFFNTGERWKTQRNRLSYALMSGKRLRILCYSVAKVCEKFTKYLDDGVKKSKNAVYEVEAKGLFNCFTGEVVASGGFGVEGDFFINGSGPNSFREAVQGFMEPTLRNLIHQTMLFFLPVLNQIFRTSFLPKRIDRYFRRVIHEMIVLRRKDGISRNDFLQLMLDNRKNEDGDIDEAGITASATSFFLDGYETSAITLAFFAYQLAENPEVQEKLRQEIKTVLKEHNGQVTYDALGEMTYMDQALNESMRLFPAVPFVVRKCNEKCKLVGNDGLECNIEAGTEIIIPIQTLQRDPEYWESPEMYIPERFNDRRKDERPKMVFLPFGEGPRICVGMRLAALQVKGAIATILKDFSLEVSTKTKRPLQYKRSAVLTAVEGGLWLNFKPL